MATKKSAFKAVGFTGQDLVIEWWPIDRPKPYERNPRKISDKAVQKVAESIKTYGFRQPIVVDKNEVIIIGHVRRLAAGYLKLTHVPVHVATNLTPAQVRGLRLADNRTAQETDWDVDLLAKEILDLKEQFDFEMNLTGFDMREIDAMLAAATGDPEAENAIPPLPENPVSRLGDLWLLDKHRVLCGDATDQNCVARLLGVTKSAGTPFLMITDPPYGVDYDPAWRNDHNIETTMSSTGRTGRGGRSSLKIPGQGKANRAVGTVSNDDRVDWSPAFALFPGDVAYVWHAGVYAGEVAVSLTLAEFQIRSQIIWAKQHFVMSRGHYHWGHEPCWYAVRKGKKSNWRGDRTQSTLWQVANLNPMGGNKDEKQTGHGTQKPVELMRRPILNHTEPGAVVYDPFLGSGSTLIAAHLTERTCVGLDLDPKYVDVIVLRWQEATKQQAILDGSGKTFAQISAERLKA